MKAPLHLLAAAFLAGCGAAAIVPAPAAPRSSMTPAAKQGDLLYVSDYETNDVYAYAYPQGKRVGVLAGVLKDFVYPTGLCADPAGDIFIPDSANASVLEYSHGGTHVIARLADTNEYPYSCAVDPVTGNLAVVNVESLHAGGGVSVYRRARGAPVEYTYPYVFSYYFAAYDDRGNLFVDATYNAPSAPFIFLELRRGQTALQMVTLEQAFRIPGGVAWDGRYLAVGDSKFATVSRFSVQGSVGKKIGSVKLSDARDLAAFVIAGARIVGASFHGRSVDFWKYPGGGAPQTRLGNLGEPFGVTLSRAPH